MRRALVFIAIALVFALWWLRAPPSQDSVSGGVDRAPTAAHVRSVPIFKADRAPASSATPAGDADQACWDKLNEQVKANRYLASIEPQLYQIVGRWFFKQFLDENGLIVDHRDPAVTEDAPEETSQTGRFYQALARAHLLVGGVQLPEDRERAFKSLMELASSDAGNSAPYLFAAVIASQQGDVTRAEQLLDRARHCTRFDVYELQIPRLVWKQVRSPTDMIEATSLTANIPVPDFSPLNTFLRKQPDTRGIALQILGPLSAAPKADAIMDIDYFVIQYASGKSLLDRSEPKNLYPKMVDVFRAHRDYYEKHGLTIWDSPSQSNCDSSLMRPYIDEVQQHLARPQ